MNPPLQAAIAKLSSVDAAIRLAGAKEIHDVGRIPAEGAIAPWRGDQEFSSLLFAPHLVVTVGVAVQPATFAKIREAHGSPRLAVVPPDQDAQEFELHFAEHVALDILTTREPGGSGAIARYLAKFGEGVQQVEFKCADVHRATQIVREKFGVAAVYPAARPGADGTLVNFFLAASPHGGKVLVELYEAAHGSNVPPR